MADKKSAVVIQTLRNRKAELQELLKGYGNSVRNQKEKMKRTEDLITKSVKELESINNELGEE